MYSPSGKQKNFLRRNGMRALTEMRFFAGMRFLKSVGIGAIFHKHPALLEWFWKWVKYAVFGEYSEEA